MRLISTGILAQLAAKELKPFQLLELALPGGTYRYTDCDVPIGARVRTQVITTPSTQPLFSFAAGQAFILPAGLDLSAYAKGAGYADHLGVELMTNGDNEAAAAGFTGSDQAVSDATKAQSPGKAHAGTKSTKVTLGGTSYYGGWQYLDALTKVSAGHVYKIEAYVYLPSGGHLDTIYIDCFTDANGWGRYSGWFDAVYTSAVSTQDAWVHYVNYVRVVDHLTWRIYCHDVADETNNAEFFYIDDVSIKEVLDDCKYQIMLHDSTGKRATGYLQAADSYEFGNATGGTELITNGTMEADANWADWSLEGGDSQTRSNEQARTGTYSRKLIAGGDDDGMVSAGMSLTAGKRYLISYWVYPVNLTSHRLYMNDTGGWLIPGETQTGLTANTWNHVTRYFTAELTCVHYLVLSSYLAGSYYFDDVSIKEIIHVGELGVCVVDAPDSHLQSWTSIESGFNYNDSQYTAIVSMGRFEPRGFKHDGAKYSMGRIVDKITLEIDNVDAQLSAEFIGGDPQGSVVSLKEVVLGADNLVVGHPITWFVGTIDDWDGEEGHLRVSLVGPNYAWSRRTSGRHPSSCRWRVFKGAECVYAGSGAFCDRSYARCAVLGNVNEFGGFRWLPSIESKEVLWGRKA